MGFLKLIVAPAALPAALSLVVALAGPGGAFEAKGNVLVSSPGTNSVAPERLALDKSVTPSDSSAVWGDTASPTPAGTNSELPGDAEAANASSHSPGCVEALTDRAKSVNKLEAHIADPGKPQGGASGNQNALDHQCGGGVASDGQGEASGEGTVADVPVSEVPSDTGNGNANGNANGHDKPAEKPTGGGGH